MAKTRINLGPPAKTRDHHHRRFFPVVIFTAMVIAVAVWGYEEGYLATMVKSMGPGFTLFFATLLLVGLSMAWYEHHKVAKELDELKEVSDNAEELKHVFQIRFFNSLGYEYVRDQIEIQLEDRLDGLQFLADQSFNIGFFGTIVGLLLAIDPLGILSTFTQETLGPKMPLFVLAMQLSFWTAMAGLMVSVVAETMLFLLERSLNIFKSRALRAFYNAMPDHQ